MQKLDFVEAIEKVYKEMFTSDVVFDIEMSLTPGLSKYGTELAVKLWDMYSNYNALKKEKKYAVILSALNGDDLFTSETVADLFKLFQGDIGQINFLKNREFRLFLDFHFTLKATYEFSKKLLTEKKITNSPSSQGASGVLIFRVFNDKDEGLSTAVYIKILKALEELCLIVSAIHDEEVLAPNIILLDSGSDTNIGLETGAKAGATIFQIFKQIYDFFKYRRHEELERNNKALLDSLNVLSEIKKKVEANEISEEEGQLWSYKVKSSVSNLLNLNVLPKELANEIHKGNILNFLNRGPLGLLAEGDDTNNVAE